MKRFMNKKVAAIGLASALALGAAGIATAYFTSTGSGSGTGSTGIASNWTVTSVSTSGGALSPGQGTDTISAVVQNPGTGNQGLNALTVTIDAPTPDATYASSGPNACTAADYALNAGTSAWVISNGGDTATYANSSAVDISAGHYVVSDADSGSTGNALPTGLTLTMNDPASNQNQCQDATVNVTVAAS